MLAAINPYRDADFFGFFSVFFQRIISFCMGQADMAALASDEIQILVLLGLSLCCAPLGFFLVYRKMTMMANALCHTILLGLVIAFLIVRAATASHMGAMPLLSVNVLVIASLATALITTFLIQLLIQKARVQEDASIGIVFTTLFALGVVLVTLYTKNMHLGTEAIMGNIDALDRDDVSLLFRVALLNILFFSLLFRGFTVSTFDPLFSQSIGFPVKLLSYILMALCAATSIAAFRAVGVLLVLTFFVAPALMARLLTKRLWPMLSLCFVLPALISLLGVALSRHILSVYDAPISTSGLVVTLFGLTYAFLVLYSLNKRSLFLFFKRKYAISDGNKG